MFSLRWRQLPESAWGAGFSLSFVLVPQAPEFGTQSRQAEGHCCPLMFEVSLRGWEVKADWRSLHCSGAGLAESHQALLSYKSPLSVYDNIFDPCCWVTCFTFCLLLHLVQRLLKKSWFCSQCQYLNTVFASRCLKQTCFYKKYMCLFLKAGLNKRLPPCDVSEVQFCWNINM